jgi:hypothetical protein
MAAALEAHGLKRKKRPGSTDLASNALFSLYYVAPSVQAVQLDIDSLVRAAHKDKAAMMSQGSSTAAPQQKGGAYSDADARQQAQLQSSHSTQDEDEQQQQQQAAPVMPLPRQLQLLSNVSASDCAAAEIIICETREGSDQHAAQLRGLLQHIAAAGAAALDVEFGSDDTTSSSTSSSMCSTEDEDDSAPYTPAQSSASSSSGSSRWLESLPAPHNSGQQLTAIASNRRLALVQLMVPAVTTDDGSWPDAIYLVRVLSEYAAAAQLLSQLQPFLEDVEVIKVVHDGRLVRVVVIVTADCWIAATSTGCSSINQCKLQTYAPRT